MSVPLATELLHPLLARAVDAVPQAVGAGIGVYDDDGGRMVAGAGCADALDELQLKLREGPVQAAAAGYDVIVSENLHTDERWPALQDALRSQAPPSDGVLAAVARPGPWNAHGVTVFSFYLSHAPRTDVLVDIAKHEAPAAIALALIETTDSQRVDQMAELVRSRGVIDQAKGVIMGHVRCAPDEAFDVLRLASQQHNVKVRDVAAALVTLVTAGNGDGDSGPRHGPRQHAPGPADKVAELVWQSLPRNG